MILGVDPGAEPTIAVLSDAGDEVAFLDGEQTSRKVLWAGKQRTRPSPAMITSQLRGFSNVRLAVIEQVWVLPKQGLSSAATFIGSAWMVEGILHGLGIRVELVRPHVWKAKVGGLTGKDKDASRERACQLYPFAAEHLTRKKDHDRAEALLLAHLGRELLTQELLQ